MRFEDVIGQSRISSELIKSVLDGQLSHAALFLGPEGCGNFAMALALSQLLVCDNPSEKGACDQCASCNKASKMVHPDIHYSFPFIIPDGKRTDNTDCDYFINEWREEVLQNPYLSDKDWLQTLGKKNGNINVKECKQVGQKLMLKSYEGGNKVWILWGAEYLGKQGNTLLKLIEEPPENTHIILVANNSQEVLGTILSRTLIYRFPQISDEAIAQYLTTLDVAPEKAETIATQSNGNLNQALNFCDDTENREEELLLDWLRTCLKNDITEINNWVDSITHENKSVQKGLISYSLYVLQLALKCRTYGPSLAFDGSIQQSIKLINDTMDYKKLTKLSQLLEKSKYYLERNVNVGLLFYNLSLQLVRVMRVKGEMA